jgi:hypothetical protein
MCITLSIAYSVKDKCINRNLLGDTRFLIDNPHVSGVMLRDSLDLLIQEEDATRALLSDRIPVFRENAFKSVATLAAMMETRG